MITLTKLRWSNLFSYGENNEIDFTKNSLTQIVGANGFGKSSIALILEEVLYNKNSKGIKKADILNRNSKAKTYSIELEFYKDDIQYIIKTVRGSTQTVKLFENGVDISSHTATSTYNTIQSIITYDHKTFSQIVYQSSAASLEFLTATDGNRKKFLIELLNLTKYIDIGEIFKEEAKQLNNKLISINTEIKTAEDWIAKYSSMPMEEMPIQKVKEPRRDLIELVSNVKEQIKTIETLNKKIAQNNKYKEMLDSIILNPSILKPEDNINNTISDKAVLNNAIADTNAFISKMRKLGAQCPTCLQPVDISKIEDLIAEGENKILTYKVKVDILNEIIEEYNIAKDIWLAEQKKIEAYEKYHALFDKSLPNELYSKEKLEEDIREYETTISEVNREIESVTAENNKALAHNARIEIIKSQLKDMRASLAKYFKELEALNNSNNIYQLLIKTFSPTGLVAYKIECLIKDLESLTNEYLAELSSGRFQITFKVTSDKLNVIITDNGKDIEIYALSSGERARVNAAALLGIRKLMQSLSNSRINLLILDETIENLDAEGKEKLVEVLLQEEFLNTFIISHSFSHPLLERIYVTKINNVSRIE